MSCKRANIITAIIMLLLGSTAILLTSRNKQQPVAHDFPEMIERGHLNIAIEQAPLSYAITGDSTSGFDYELLQMIAHHADIAINIHPVTSLSSSLKGLNSHQYDIVAYHLPITTVNKQHYLFTRPLLLNKYVLIQRNDSNIISNQLDLGNCTLHLTQATPLRTRIENLAHEIGTPIKICEMHDYGADQLIAHVASGEIEYTVCDEATAAIIAPQYDNIDYSLDISFTQMMSWAMRPESVILHDSIDTWLSEIQETAEYKTLYTKYFGKKSYDQHLRIANIVGEQ